MKRLLPVSLAAAALAAGLALAAQGALAEIIFDAPFLSTAGGETPQGLAAGDLNGDGKVDLVSAASYAFSNELSVNLGLGDGRFAPPVDYTCGTWCWDIAIGDVNGDGKLDVVTANRTADVSLLLGNGDGTLGPNVEYATFSAGSPNSRSVVIADLNGDGRGDVIVTTPNSPVLSILPGNADGTLGPRVDLTMATSSNFVLVADFNHDGLPDIMGYAFVGNDTELSLRLNNGSFSFGPGILVDAGAHYPSSIGRMAAGDFDHDGKLDVAFIESSSASAFVGVCLGNGDGTFGPAATFANEKFTQYLAAGDFDGDGKIDLAASRTGDGLVVLLRGHGDGTFEPGRDFASVSSARGVAVVDVNGDGRDDLALSGHLGSAAGVLLGNAAGGFGDAREFSVGTQFEAGSGSPSQVAVGDVNHDGIPDIATISGSPDSLDLLLNDGSANFPVLLRSPIEPSAQIALADFDGDGIPDLLTENSSLPNGDSDSTVTIRHGNGNGTFGPPARWFVGRGPVSVQIADVNHDGKRDLVVLCGFDETGGVIASDAHRIAAVLGNGNGTFQPPVAFETGDQTSSFAVGNLDHDGNPDIVYSRADANRVGTLMGNGDGTFIPGPSFDMKRAGTLALGDVNQDGVLDLAIEHTPGASRPDSVAVMLGAGDGSFTAFHELLLRGSYQILGLVDLDRDGHLDLALQTSASALSVWSGHGDGNFTPPITDFGLGSEPNQVAFADLNGDLLPDVVAVNLVMDDVQVLVNRTPSGSTAVPPSLEAPSASSLALAGSFPNPARGDRLVAAFSLVGREPARLELFDLAGRRLVAREVGAFGAGAHRVDLAAGRRFAPGVYLLRLTQSGVTRTARVAVLE